VTNKELEILAEKIYAGTRGAWTCTDIFHVLLQVRGEAAARIPKPNYSPCMIEIALGPYWEYPAFPAPSESVPPEKRGLTKLEWFAGQALQGILSNGQVTLKCMAPDAAVDFAKALTEELDRERSKGEP
jgi:hypothetical protein